MLACLGSANDELTAKEFLVVQLRHGALGFVDCLHLHKGEPFRALVVLIADHLCVLDVANAVEQVEQIAFSSVEGQIADVETRRRYFNRLRFALGPGLLRLRWVLLFLILMRTVT